MLYLLKGAVSVLTSISGLLAQFLSGAQFYIYSQSQKKLTYFHKSLEQLQRFLVANSVCESLQGESREKARAELVKMIVTFDTSAQSKKE